MKSRENLHNIYNAAIEIKKKKIAPQTAKTTYGFKIKKISTILQTKKKYILNMK